jgi:hypothetical protein
LVRYLSSDYCTLFSEATEGVQTVSEGLDRLIRVCGGHILPTIVLLKMMEGDCTSNSNSYHHHHNNNNNNHDHACDNDENGSSHDKENVSKQNQIQQYNNNIKNKINNKVIQGQKFENFGFLVPAVAKLRDLQKETQRSRLAKYLRTHNHLFRDNIQSVKVSLHDLDQSLMFVVIWFFNALFQKTREIIQLALEDKEQQQHHHHHQVEITHTKVDRNIVLNILFQLIFNNHIRLPEACDLLVYCFEQMEKLKISLNGFLDFLPKIEQFLECPPGEILPFIDKNQVKKLLMIS